MSGNSGVNPTSPSTDHIPLTSQCSHGDGVYPPGAGPQREKGEGWEAVDPSASHEPTGARPRKREQWTRKVDFLLACIGFSVGLGNVWRFPYLCYKNGGGAFLLPYFLCVVVGGIPCFYLEVALGQFMQQGGIGVWNICPLFRGIGYATTILVFLVNVYYNIILSWAFYYLFASFTSVLPWSHCDNPWNTPHCRRANDSDVYNQTMNATTVPPERGFTIATLTNVTSAANQSTGLNFVDPVTEYWERKVLDISSGIDDMGTIKWDLALCLLFAWAVVYLCIWKGIKSSGKVMYFTATAPYLLMAVLLVRGVTLPGSLGGITYYLVPDWQKLAHPQVWVDAGTQIFFSYSISLGTLTALGSYNKYNHNSWRDSMAFTCINSGTSFFAGFVIFSVLGFMAHEQGVSVGQVAESGPGLAFIAYPKAVAEMPLAPLWSILFFLMIILLGLDSQFVGVEGFVTAIVDEFPRTLRRGHRRELFVLGVCIVSFFIGLSMVTNGGMYVFQLWDYYSSSRIIPLILCLECVVVAWIYGVGRFYDNIEMMYGFRLSPYMRICWKFITPVFTLVMFGLCVYCYSELTYNRTYQYPRWAIGVGWLMASCSVLMVPLTVIVSLARVQGSIAQRFRFLLRPRLKPHQLRSRDDLKDLADDIGSESLDGAVFNHVSNNSHSIEGAPLHPKFEGMYSPDGVPVKHLNNGSAADNH